MPAELIVAPALLPKLPLQLYELPPLAVTLIDVVAHVNVEVPVLLVILAVGAVVFTVAVTASVSVQPVAVCVFVTVYVVVLLGLAVGLAAVLELRLPPLFQEYVYPLSELSPIALPLAFELQVFVKSLPAEAVTVGVLDPIVILSVSVQPLLAVTVTV